MKKNVPLFLFTSSIIHLKHIFKIWSISLIIMLTLTPQNMLQACGGTPPPPCGRSIFLAKFTSGTVVLPPAGGAIDVPIGALPFAEWNIQGLPAAPICPQPVAATMTLTLTCFPSGTVIGPQAFSVAVPTIPGAQPVGGPVNFVIPAGVFPAGSPPQICLVSGTYSLTFSDGIVLSFIGDTEVCIVPPTSLDETVPRLDMRYLSDNDDGYKNCRRGDQANFYFLIANNDPEQSVSLDLNSIGRQVAQLPDGISPQEAYQNDVYSISFPEPGTDTYAAAFSDEIMPGALLAEPDPGAINDQFLSRSFTLQPCEAIIIGITMRSYGMCANGSCNERLVKVEGTFANGDPALACASTLYVVDDAPPKSVLCEFLDSVKVSPMGFAEWSPGEFNDPNGPIPHAKTFAAGNTPPGNDPLFRTTGDNQPGLFSATGSDYLRIDRPTTGMSYEVFFNSPQCGDGANIVNLQGIESQGMNLISIPIITFQGIAGPLDLNFNFQNNQVLISAQGNILFQGPIDLFFADPPPEFCIDVEMCRIIQKRTELSDKSISVHPPAIARLFVLPDVDPACDTLEVFNNSMTPADWNATISGSGITLTAASGTGTIEACYGGLSALPPVPQTTITYMEVTCPGGINTVRVPFAIRMKDSTVNTTTIFPEDLKEKYVLQTCTPNPFTTMTNINYSLTESAALTLKIYNTFGQEVRILIDNDSVGAGQHTHEWDGRDATGNLLGSGLYICQMSANGVVSTSNVVLIR